MQQVLLSAPGIILAVLGAIIILRAVRDLIAGRRGEGLIGRLLRILSDPVVRPVRAMTPKIVPDGLVYALAISWLVAARIIWFIASAALGARSGLGG